MSSLSTRSRTVCAVTASRFREVAAAWSCGLGQIVFSGSPAGGILVLLAAAVLSPWAAIFLAAGSALGTAVGRVTSIHDALSWRHGIAGYNLAIVGSFASGTAVLGGQSVWAVAAATIACLAIELALVPVGRRLRMPFLSFPAIATVTVISLLWAGPGDWLWADPPGAGTGRWGIALAGVAIVAALSLVSTWATLQAMAAAAIAAAVGTACGFDLIESAGLWVFAAGIAGFAVQAVFVPGRAAGAVLGAVASASGIAIWLAWQLSGLGDHIQPTLMPFLLAVWITLGIWRLTSGSRYWQDGYWAAAWSILRAGRSGGIVVSVAAQHPYWDPDKPAPDQWTWLPRGLTPRDFSVAALTTNQERRRIFWEAASELAAQLGEAGQDDGASDLAAVSDIVLSRTRLWARTAREPVIALNGCPDRTRCLGCDAKDAVPPRQVWQRFDIRCQTCGAPVVPDLVVDDDDWSPNCLDQLAPLPPNSVLIIAEGPVARSPVGDRLSVWARATGTTVVQQANPGFRPPSVEPDILVPADSLSFPGIRFFLRMYRRSGEGISVGPHCRSQGQGSEHV